MDRLLGGTRFPENIWLINSPSKLISSPSTI